MVTPTWWRKDRSAYSPLGIDVGTNAVSIVQLRKTNDGIALHAAVTSDIRPEEIQDTPGMIRLLKELVRKGRFVGRTAVSRLPDSEVTIIPIRLEAEKDTIETALVGVAGDYLPYPLEEAVLDYIAFQQEASDNQKVLLIAAKRRDVEQHLELLKASGCLPIAIDVVPNALFRTVQFAQHEEKNRVLLINVGSDQTFFTILWDGHLLIDRPVQWGHHRLVNTLGGVLDVDQDEAQRMLRLYGINPRPMTTPPPDEGTDVLPEEAVSHEIFEITAEELEQFVAEAEKVLVYCASENQGATINQIYLLGAGPFLRNFNAFLEARLGIEVSSLDPFRRVLGGYHGHANPSALGIATGLALRGFDPDGA